MSKAAPCPTADELKRFQLGDLPEAAGEVVQLHLASCRTCLAALQRLRPSDSLVASLREQETFAIAEDDVVRGLIGRLLDSPILSGARTREVAVPPRGADLARVIRRKQ